MESMSSKFECSICDWCGDDMLAHLKEKHPERLEIKPICPTCYESATFKDAQGVLWCANAHYWKPKVPAEAEPEKGSE
jgi:ribosomal protein L33